MKCQDLFFLLRSKRSSVTEIHHNLEIPTSDPLKYIMDNLMQLHLSVWETPLEYKGSIIVLFYLFQGMQKKI